MDFNHFKLSRKSDKDKWIRIAVKRKNYLKADEWAKKNWDQSGHELIDEWLKELVEKENL